MSIPLIINGVTYNYPSPFDTNWAPVLDAWSTAVSTGLLQKAGGSFPLTAEVDFGNSFGLRCLYMKSEESNVSSTGFFRLANASPGVGWRNAANSGDLLLTVNASDQITFNGVAFMPLTSLQQDHIFIGNASNAPVEAVVSGDATMTNTAPGLATLLIANGAILNANVNNVAAIAVTKLAALTPSELVVTDGSGFISAQASPSLTEIGYVAGVTSSIQTQINSISSGVVPSGAMLDFGGTAAPSGWLLCDGTSYLRATYPNLFTAIGSTWGSADGTHFNVPDFSRRVSMGSGGSGTGTIGNAVGNTGGAESVTVTQASHTHIQDTHQHVTPIANAGNTTFFIPQTGAGWSGGTTSLSLTWGDFAPGATGGPTAENYFNTTNTVATNQSTTATNNAGSVIQPAAIVLKIIKI